MNFFPSSSTDSAAPASKSVIPRSPRPFAKRILIVEDDLTIKPILERMLEKLSPGITVDWATSAEAALTRLAEGSQRRTRVAALRNLLDPYYSVVLSDVRLAGEKSGIDLVDDCFAQSIPVRFVLASAQSAVDSPLPFLPKPFRMDDVRGLLGPYLEGNRVERSMVIAGQSIHSFVRRARGWMREQRSTSALEWLLFATGVYICASTLANLPEGLGKLPFAPFPSASEMHSHTNAPKLTLEDYLGQNRSERRVGAF